MSLNLLRLFGGRNASAPVARERLQILLAHERGLLGQPDLLGTLREEILAVVSRHVVLDPGKVVVKLNEARPYRRQSISKCSQQFRQVEGRRRPAKGASESRSSNDDVVPVSFCRQDTAIALAAAGS